MKHNQYPIRRALIAAGAAVGALATTTACSAENPAPAPTVTVTKTVPAPSPSTSEAKPTPSTSTSESKAASAEVETVKKDLKQAAIDTSRGIANDLANPKSLSELYSGDGVYSVGNKHLAIEAGRFNRPNFPEMFVHYTPGDHTLFFNSISSPNPNVPTDRMHFNNISLSFSLGATPNNLDAKLATGKLPTAEDFAAVLANPNIELQSFSIQNTDDSEASVVFKPTGDVTLQRSQRLTEASSSVNLSAGTQSDFEAAIQNLEANQAALNEGLINS